MTTQTPKLNTQTPTTLKEQLGKLKYVFGVHSGVLKFRDRIVGHKNFDILIKYLRKIIRKKFRTISIGF